MKPKEEPTKKVCVRLPTSLIYRLALESLNRGVTRTEIIIEALEEKLKESK